VLALSGQLASRTAAHENKYWLRFISHTLLKFCVALIPSTATVSSTVFLPFDIYMPVNYILLSDISFLTNKKTKFVLV
jgi:hypothetical protein